MFGFEKNERDNIDARELAVLQALARALIDMKPSQLESAIEASELVEIKS